MGFTLAHNLYTKLREGTEKLYLLFDKHRDTRAAVRIAGIQTWSVAGTIRPVSTKPNCMKVTSSCFIGAAVLLKFVHLQRSDSWATTFFSPLWGQEEHIRVLSHSTSIFRCMRVIPSHSFLDYSQKWSFAFCAGEGGWVCIPWAPKSSVHKPGMGEAVTAAAISVCFRADAAAPWHFTVRIKWFFVSAYCISEVAHFEHIFHILLHAVSEWRWHFW